MFCGFRTWTIAAGGFDPSEVLELHPGELTWNLKIDLWKTIFLYKPVVFRFHVNLPECNQELLFVVVCRLSVDVHKSELDCCN